MNLETEVNSSELYTKKIILDQVEPSVFNIIQKHCKRDIKFSHKVEYYRMRDAIQMSIPEQENTPVGRIKIYSNLILMMLNHPNAIAVGVNIEHIPSDNEECKEKGILVVRQERDKVRKWVKRSRFELINGVRINLSEIRYLAHIASLNPFRSHYLEIRYLRPPTLRVDIRPDCVLAFKEEDNQIIGNDLYTLNKYNDLFTVNRDPHLPNNHRYIWTRALWIPPHISTPDLISGAYLLHQKEKI
jgi:hypothetical protein